MFADTRVSSNTGTVEAEAEIANPDGALKPGQFVRVRLLGALRPNAVKVPARAVLEGPQGKYVYIAADGKAAPRPVTVGDQLADGWIITKGLAAGDALIVDGMARIFFPGAPIQVGAASAPSPAPDQRPPPPRPASRPGARACSPASSSTGRSSRPCCRCSSSSPVWPRRARCRSRSTPRSRRRWSPSPRSIPGASAEVIEQTVAAPLENAINGAEHMIYMASTSTSNGVVTIQVTFDIGADVDQAAQTVNNRVKQAEAKLPLEVRRQGVTVEKGSSAFLQVQAFFSPDGSRDDLTISNYVTLNVLDSLKRVPGTTSVQIFGAKDWAMRIWLKPDRLAQLKLTTGDVARAINEQNAQFAAGKVGQAPTGGGQEMVYTITTQGRLTEPKQFEEILLRTDPDGSTLRLKDVARVELGAKDYDFIGRINGKPATLVGIFLQPGANALDVAAEVNRTVAELATRFPKGMTYSVPYDTTRFVKVSIEEVIITLAEAMLLVIAVVFLFLQSWRATLIPLVAVPVSLIGTFAGLLLLGYSINTLTLFGMVLAIGIVVDDAIVVLENVERIMREQHLEARDAAIKAMHEVSGPVIAIVLVLCAVFVPIAFLGGLSGELYRQFAATISIAVVISGMVALTLTPSLCVMILRKGHRKPGRFFAWFNRSFLRVTGHYVDGVGFMVRRAGIGLLLFAGMVALAAGLWRITPGSLVPDEDQGCSSAP